MRTINLALQGGGSHGAFTWGVLDALLADGRLQPEGISGASAGAVNAVALASGWAAAEAAGRDPSEGAREALRKVWTQVASWVSLGDWQQQLVRMLWGGLVSPYNANPLGINPLRDLLVREIDFERIRHGRVKVFVSATHVNTGKAVVFGGAQLDLSAVLASACLPMLFQAVEIDGQPYWDGGYSVNPPLSPLISQCASSDIMLIQINPLTQDAAPRTPQAIQDRVNELTFNASLLTQMRAIDFVNRLLEEGELSHARCRKVLVHRIDGGLDMQAFPSSSRSSTDAAMIDNLFTLGQGAARHWLARHFDALGRHATVDIRRDYLDDTRIELPRKEVADARRLRPGFRPWLARLLRQGPKS